jgi:uncharacterized iron-regulated membrane protein
VSTRSVLVLLHRWIGVPFAVLLLLQGLSGAALIFRDDLNRWLHQDALVVTPAGNRLPVQKLLESVRNRHPDCTVTRIIYPDHADEAFVFRLEPHGADASRFVAVDPYRGTITRDGPIGEWPVEWLFRLHDELFAGKAGANIVGAEAVALLLLAVVGPILWWPGRRALRRGFSITFSKGAYRGLRDVHRIAGAIVAIVLLVSACTGIFNVWKVPLQPAVRTVLPTIARPSPAVPPRMDSPLLPIDAIVAAAQARYSPAQVRNVRFPGGHGRLVVVFMNAADSTRPRASNQVWLNGYTAEVLGAYEAQRVPAGNRFIDWMLPIHTGEFLGMPGRIVFLLAGLTLAGLATTGLWQWWERRKLLKAGPTGAAAAAPLR